MTENAKKSSSGMIFFAWLLVGIPLGWGVYNTVLSSEKLFAPGQMETAAPIAPVK